MQIEKIANNRITITLSSSVDKFGLQRIINYLKYLETTAASNASQTEIDKLADEINNSWWQKNKSRFVE